MIECIVPMNGCLVKMILAFWRHSASHQNVRPVILYIVYSLCVSFSDFMDVVTNVIHFHWQFVGTLYFTVYCVRASDGIVSILNDICDLSSRNLVSENVGICKI